MRLDPRACLLTFPTAVGLLAACTGRGVGSTPSAVASAPVGSPTDAMVTPSSAAPTQKPAEHRIGVRTVEGKAEFFDRISGETFVPRGADLVRLAPLLMIGGGTVTYHSTFNVGRYDPVHIEAALSEMADLGYNTVRVFLDGNCRAECIGDESGGLRKVYIENLVDFLERAKAHGIVVLLTSDIFPATDEYLEILDSTWSEDFVGGNSYYLQRGGIRADIHYMQALIRALQAAGAPMDAIFANQLRNEIFFGSDAPPFRLEAGEVTTANGELYDMAVEADKERMLEDGLLYWFDQVRDAILELDPTALVTVGFFHPQDPNPSRIGDARIIETERFLRESSADLVDLHLYPGFELTMAQYLENYKLADGQDRPILMGEYGAATASYPTAAAAAQALHDWQVESCKYGFDGWLHWTWDTDEDSSFYHGQSDGGVVNRALAPAERSDPCKEGTFLREQPCSGR